MSSRKIVACGAKRSALSSVSLKRPPVQSSHVFTRGGLVFLCWGSGRFYWGIGLKPPSFAQLSLSCEHNVLSSTRFLLLEGAGFALPPRPPLEERMTRLLFVKYYTGCLRKWCSDFHKMGKMTNKQFPLNCFYRPGIRLKMSRYRHQICNEIYQLLHQNSYQLIRNVTGKSGIRGAHHHFHI